MAIETLKENLCVNQIIGKLKENVIAEDDVIIPDIKPDILSTIDTNGMVCVYKKEILDGKIRIDGGVQVYIMYLADDENGSVRGINTVINFSKVIDMEKINPNMNMEMNVNLREIECKILNGRKVNIKASIDVDGTVYSNENVEFVNGIEGRDDIQVLNKYVTIDSLLGTGSTKVYAKDTINIESTDNLAEVLNVNTSIINKEIKTSYNKILAKADMQVNIVYLTDDNRVMNVNWKIPVMGFIDMQDISDDNLCSLNYETKNILIKPNNVEEHSVYVEIELEISCSAYEKKELNIIQDLYSPSECLDINQKDITVVQGKQCLRNSCTVRERLAIPDLHNKISSSEVIPRIVKQSIYNDRVICEGELQVKLMYLSSSTNRMEIKNETLQFSVTFENTGVQPSYNLVTQVDILSQDFITSPDGNIETNIELEVTADSSKVMEVKVIDNIDISDDNDENIYSIVVYFVKPGDTLWDIAKKFKSTIKAISSVNGIDDDNINVGQQLFIPKFV